MNMTIVWVKYISIIDFCSDIEQTIDKPESKSQVQVQAQSQIENGKRN